MTEHQQEMVTKLTNHGPWVEAMSAGEKAFLTKILGYGPRIDLIPAEDRKLRAMWEKYRPMMPAVQETGKEMP
jgi:hypothetical protein